MDSSNVRNHRFCFRFFLVSSRHVDTKKKLEIAEVEREGSGNVKVAAVIDTSRWKRNESNTDHTSSRSQAAFHCAGWHYFSYYSALIEELLLFDSLLLLGRAAYGTASDES
jgi:hypothetical protein